MLHLLYELCINKPNTQIALSQPVENENELDFYIKHKISVINDLLQLRNQTNQTRFDDGEGRQMQLTCDSRDVVLRSHPNNFK